ncbi:lysophospholipid acyltransferase family protein [Roseivirga sp.]|uniref:lysophospholipid acyltransferase family protein n=1 Tax=Roseivirga sp. TaxID=1964215 RepID=UPI003B52C7AF
MMRLTYYLFLKPISLLPWPLLYGFSSFCYWLVYKIFRYRSKIVTGNLTRSFPDKSHSEIKRLRDQFYRHFFDVTLESIKTFSISRKDMFERFKVRNPEVVDQFLKEGRSVILAGGHYNNWEYLALAIDPYLEMQTAGIYHQFKNKFFQEKMLQLRGRFGMKLISRSEVREGCLDNSDEQLALFFANDQSPTIAKKVYWTTFLNQETAVAFGIEKYAKQLDAPVVYFEIEKVKRGFYETSFRLLNDNPLEAAHGELTELHTQALEATILKNPVYWLWTHKRWKRKRKEGE